MEKCTIFLIVVLIVSLMAAHCRMSNYFVQQAWSLRNFVDKSIVFHIFPYNSKELTLISLFNFIINSLIVFTCKSREECSLIPFSSLEQ